MATPTRLTCLAARFGTTHAAVRGPLLGVLVTALLTGGFGCGPATAPGADKALVLALASFAPRSQGGAPKPLPARLEFLTEQADGTWALTTLSDSESNVFHKAMAYVAAPGPPASELGDGGDGGGVQLLTAGGTEAALKLWSSTGSGELESSTLWKRDFGGKFSRMRDVEVADLFGDGRASLAVATHDQGVVATLQPDGRGGFSVVELDQEPDTFVHEVEVGDLDGDGVLEVYATPSEPNRLDGSPQSGAVVRYVPKTGEGRVVVADLGERHAKEILVDDVDGDGRDELYVVVEGKMDPQTGTMEHGVEIRRYDAGTDPAKGIVIAEIRDRLCRFLTAGDVDGDGRKELVAAAFKSGLWLLRPGSDAATRPWKVTSIDRSSGGFEHAALLTDLDGDGLDELYVASDNDREVRRYAWDGKKLARQVIYKRKTEGGVFTWNVMPVPSSLVPR
jgi:hypothetical protein